MSFAHFEQVGEHKSNRGLIKKSQSRWGASFSTYKANKTPNLVKVEHPVVTHLKNTASGVKGAATSLKKALTGSGIKGTKRRRRRRGGGGRKGGGGGPSSMFGAVTAAPGGFGGGVRGMALAGFKSAGQVAFPVPGVAEATSFAHETSDYLRSTGRSGADAMNAAGGAGRNLMAGGGLAGLGAEKVAEKLNLDDPEGLGQVTFLGVGAAIEFAMVEGGALGSFGGPLGLVAGAVIGGAAGFFTYYAIR
ncbi:hypothetical protein HJFPF1_12392 [Paramyrothecium foliicola]|nr:hypothetical protein HJFPF1_12392 [Paramyrothecium foliicola]